jgi:hypothetical protein
MPAKSIDPFLTPPFAKKHATSAIKHFSKMVEEFLDGEWENCIAKAGKFVEASLKALFVHVGKTPPAGRGFKADSIINGLAQVPDDGTFPDSIRLTIPRACRFVYDMASNRGGRHDAGDIDPNQMDANAAVMTCSWVLAEMIRVAQKGAVDLDEARVLLESLVERKYPVVEEVEGRMYFHVKNKTAPDVALMALARRHPARMGRQDLIDTVRRNGFSLNNARVAVTRISKMVDDDGSGNLRLLVPGLRRAEQLLKQSAN